MIMPPVVPCSGSMLPRACTGAAVARGLGAFSLGRALTDLPGPASLAGSSLRLADAPPVVLGLLLSTWGRYERPAVIWREGEGVAWAMRLGKAAACAAFKLPGTVRAVRSVAWREIDPAYREIAFSRTHCVLVRRSEPARVFKLELYSFLQSEELKQAWLDANRAGYEALARYLGEYLEPTHFERRQLGSRTGWSVTGLVQRKVDGEPFIPRRLTDPDAYRSEPHLRAQWRAICEIALRAEAETGRLLDAVGHDNVRIERMPGQRSRLRIVDTLPVPTPGFLPPPSRAEVVEQARRILIEGARIQGA